MDDAILVGDRFEWSRECGNGLKGHRRFTVGRIDGSRVYYTYDNAAPEAEEFCKLSEQILSLARRLPREPQVKACISGCPAPNESCPDCCVGPVRPTLKVGDVVRDASLLKPGMRVRKHYSGGRTADVTLTKLVGGSWYDENDTWSFDAGAYVVTEGGLTILALPESDSQKTGESNSQASGLQPGAIYEVPGRAEDWHAQNAKDPGLYKCLLGCGDSGRHVCKVLNAVLNARPEDERIHPTSGRLLGASPVPTAKPEPKPSDPWAVHLAEEAKIRELMLSVDHGFKDERHYDRQDAREWLRSGGDYEAGRNGMGVRVGGIWRLR